MIPVRELRTRDRGAYYSDTIVFRIRDSKPFRVLEFNEEDDYLQIIAVDKPDHARTQTIHVNDLQDNFILHRPLLGWRNYGLGCIFASSTPGRGYKKGYTREDFICTSPIHDHTIKLLEEAHAQFQRKLREGLPDDALKEHEREMANIDKAISSMEYLNPNPRNYLSAYSQPFVSKNDAIELVSNNYLGVATNPHWAIIQLPNNSKERATVFYQDSAVGSIDLTNHRATFFAKCKELESAWNRIK